MNANGMIDTAADYAFIDFANGDLPAANIDGHPMPLRVVDGDRLKAEDVAFLYEGIRDKVGALYGATRRGVMWEPYFHPDKKYSPDPVAVPLTRKIISAQMTTLWDYMDSARATGSSGVRFLKTAMGSRPNLVPASQTTFIPFTALRSAFVSEFEGVGAMTAVRADFGVGEPVAQAPVSALFDDMKLFSRPCGFLNFDLASECDSSCFVVTGSGRLPGVQNTIGYRLQNFFDAQGGQTASSYAALNVMKTGVEMFSIPLKYVSDSGVKLWMLYSAYNLRDMYTQGHDPTTIEHIYDYRGGLIDVTQRFPASDADGVRTYYSHNGESANLLRDIERLYGWTEEPLGGSCYVQSMGVTFWTEFIVEFAPSGRTKWWSD